MDAGTPGGGLIGIVLFFFWVAASYFYGAVPLICSAIVASRVVRFFQGFWIAYFAATLSLLCSTFLFGSSLRFQNDALQLLFILVAAVAAFIFFWSLYDRFSGKDRVPGWICVVILSMWLGFKMFGVGNILDPQELFSKTHHLESRTINDRTYLFRESRFYSSNGNCSRFELERILRPGNLIVSTVAKTDCVPFHSYQISWIEGGEYAKLQLILSYGPSDSTLTLADAG